MENWTWGLSLIALTIAIHGAGVISIALPGVSIRARIESWNQLTLRQVAAILIGTRGASGLVLERHWRMMGALEATDGMLLFGISTAFIFAMMQAYWPLMTRRHPH